ncbi:MAG: A/G-specific adenine glycosylase [Ponticaulis sp.]|nr:A/G-specific adenine glycosylase [Ponticaulis sp.]
MLHWYDEHARDLPWRVSPELRKSGMKPDPYRVWLSEIMLQQTTIPHATRYFLEFTRRWRNVHELAAADRDEIMAAWAGLGYYSRARNLHACAQLVSEMGGFPEAAQDLQKLPGIGPYTSGAIAAIAFDEPVAAVDGNVERVVTRFHAIAAPLPSIKKDIKAIVEEWVPRDRPGDFAQAMMDLGATICTPRSPSCMTCPVAEACVARLKDTQGSFPVKAAKTQKPKRRGTAYIVVRDGRLLAEKRPDTGLLAGMLGLPTTEWTTNSDKLASDPASGTPIGSIQHVFTHFSLTLDAVIADDADVQNPVWVPIKDWKKAGFPSVFQKIIGLYLKTEDEDPKLI